MSPPPLATKPKKGKSQTVTSTLPKSQDPEASRALSKKRKRPKPKNLPIKTKVTPPKPTEGSKQSHSVSSGTIPDTQDLERDIQHARGNKQPLDRDIPFTIHDEGTAKTTSRPEGSLGDKDLGGNIPPANMEPIYTSVADPLGTGAKYQTFADIQAYLLSKDELDKESDEEEVLAAGDDMDKDIQAAEEVRTPSPKQDQPEPSQVQESASNSSSPDLKRFDNTLPLTERQLIKYLRKASIDQYYDENLAHRDQTDKLMEAPMSSLDRSNTTISDLYKGLDVITQLLKDINNAVKDDLAGLDFSALLSTVKDLQAHALKQEEASTAWTKSSTNMAWNLGSRMTAVEICQTSLKCKVSSLKQDTLEIKSMMAEIYQAFKGQPSFAPSGSVTPTFALTHIQANIEGENATNTAIKEPPSHTKGETGDATMAIPISSIQPTHAINPTNSCSINHNPIFSHPESSQATSRTNKINYLTEQEIQVYWDKDEKIKKATEEAKLLAMYRPEVIKVVREEAKKLGINPKDSIFTKASETFKKA
ncbi:hypothetical protein Tco_0090537 [Tanacetum coccineum]